MARKTEKLSKKIFEDLEPVWKTIGERVLIVQKSGEIYYANQDCLDGISMTFEELKSADLDQVLPTWNQLTQESEKLPDVEKLAFELRNSANDRVVVFQNMQRISFNNDEVYFFHQKDEPALIPTNDGSTFYRMALDHINDPLFIWKKIKQKEIVLKYCNQAAQQIFQFEDRDWTDMNLIDFSNHFSDITRMINKTFKTGRILRQEICIDSDHKGHEKWFLSDFIPVNKEYLININVDISAQKQDSLNYADQKRQMETLLKNLPGIAYRCKNDENWTMEFVSDGSFEILGYYPTDLVENKVVSYGDLIHPDDRQQVWDEIQAKLAEKLGFQIIYRVITSDQKVKHVWEKGQGFFSDKGEILAVEGFISDVTERVDFEKNAQKARIQAEALQEAMAELSSQLDLSQILRRILLSLRKILAYDSATLFLKVDDQLKVVAARGFKNTSRLIDKTFPDDNILLNEIQNLEKPIILEDAQKDPRFDRWEGANAVHGWLGVPLIRRSQFLGFLTIDSYSVGAYHQEDAVIAQTFADEAAIMIENARLYERAQQMATFDALTGIHNRRYFFDEAMKEFKRSHRYKTNLSVIMIDIDHFKLINDRYGHAAGDKVLIQFVGRVKRELRNSDILARYGGEEFSILLPETGIEQAKQAAERIREEIAYKPFQTGDSETYITISLGVAEISDDITQLDQLIDRSDKALYESKQFGRNRVRIWRDTTK